jgi:DNA-directed RNA polymerase specialized sigma24 family protein
MPMTATATETARQLRREGLSYRAIAERLGVDASTVRRRLNQSAAQKMNEYNRARRQQATAAVERKVGHQFPWEGVE